MSSSGFENWTQAQIESRNAEVAKKFTPIGGRRAGMTNSANQEIVKHIVETSSAHVMIAKKDCVLSIEKKESTDVQKLNKTERAFYNLLMVSNHQCVYVQALTLKLADDCRLTVDFVHLTQDGKLIFTDVKGFQREDALIKMKVAARMFPMFHFQIVKRIKGNWDITPVKP